jgi:hypothetical protein
MDSHQTFSFGERQRPENDGVDRREDSAVGADAEPERHHHDCGKARALAPLPQCVAEIRERVLEPGKLPRLAALPARLPGPNLRRGPGNRLVFEPGLFHRGNAPVSPSHSTRPWLASSEVRITSWMDEGDHQAVSVMRGRYRSA